MNAHHITKQRNSFRILLYHSVGEIDPRDNLGTRISPEAFTSQMEYVKKSGFNVMPLEEAFSKLQSGEDIPENSLVLTFDDGYKDNLTNAVPILEKFNFKAAFFITDTLVGGVKTKPERYWQYWECLTWPDIKKIESMGHAIGSHSITHTNLNKLSIEEKVKEIRLSKEKFEANLKEHIEFFSYPYGYFNNEVIGALKGAGYKAACTSLVGLNTGLVNPYKLRRTEVMRYHTMDDLKKRLNGRDDWLRFFKKEFYS